MSTLVLLATLVSAAMHAGWHAIAKSSANPLVAMASVNCVAAIIALPLLLFYGLPDSAALPWLAAAAVFKQAYYVVSSLSYRRGDLSQLYPLARGSAPVIVAVFSLLFIGEGLGVLGWIGLLVTTLGLTSVGLSGGRPIPVSDVGTLSSAINRDTVVLALATGAIIAAYSLFDALGARSSGSPMAYAALATIIDGTALTVIVASRFGPLGLQLMTKAQSSAVLGGIMAFASFWIAMWAVTEAPIALVSALRECSVLFASLIGVVLLKEPLRLGRLLGAGVILVGLSTMHIGG